ncbi:MAG: hypothetical protein A3G32_01555 [Deltaproteobacteria bacterium RIFCSPLOWO2_12_FULL_40_28]|nr:MAG: hypothetical protein A3C45_06300 [Deltaproteobacteria bacterium RIFCSPHIGHO2_02_FULL_40_28]OGQ18818.1 MAG: hypothetical protein A3E27_08935 [Deltaproteobacteria bacterium RIFCSPHIGHO2_12_FULL_40_32]OGQ40063.1 MAG: hypothetical protein A3I69_01465 [Deltaproteobacteria bacterium RIFCSPLOWO2_02_FULL_40_36]OGQ53246.1 MAG: hypothetical protein A3G32_01555 [Deltaproteobacteria bacterium RIFCSPLOWO2_12_FULL_40_28]
MFYSGMSKPGIQPYPFDLLKKYTFEDVAIHKYIANAFDEANDLLLEQFINFIRKIVGPSFDVGYEDFSKTSFEQYGAIVPAYPILAVATLTPYTKPVMIEFASHLAFAIIDKLLGGENKRQVNHELTSLEQGMLKYFLVKVASLTPQVFENKNRALVLSRLIVQRKEILSLLPKEEALVVFNFKVALNQTVGPFRILVPKEMLKDMALKNEIFWSQTMTHENQKASKRFAGFEHFRCVSWLEVGRAELSHSDLSQLERGDIVLLDESYPDYDGKHLSGLLKLRIGDGTQGGFDVRLTSDKPVLKVSLEGVFSE